MLHGRVLRDSEIACYASHYLLWEKCVELNKPIIVLEDDIYFEPHFLQGIQEIVESKFQFVRFYFMDKRREKYAHQIGNSNFYYSLKNLNGTQGYYLTPPAAAAFMAMPMWDSPVDVAMEFVLRHKVNNIIYKPFLIGENDFATTSTIKSIPQPEVSNQSQINSVQITTKYRILKPFYRNFIQLKRFIFKLYYTPPKIRNNKG